jgi:hypothetical protein
VAMIVLDISYDIYKEYEKLKEENTKIKKDQNLDTDIKKVA